MSAQMAHGTLAATGHHMEASVRNRGEDEGLGAKSPKLAQQEAASRRTPSFVITMLADGPTVDFSAPRLRVMAGAARGLGPDGTVGIARRADSPASGCPARIRVRRRPAARPRKPAQDGALVRPYIQPHKAPPTRSQPDPHCLLESHRPRRRRTTCSLQRFKLVLKAAGSRARFRTSGRRSPSRRRSASSPSAGPRVDLPRRHGHTLRAHEVLEAILEQEPRAVRSR